MLNFKTHNEIYTQLVFTLSASNDISANKNIDR